MTLTKLITIITEILKMKFMSERRLGDYSRIDFWSIPQGLTIFARLLVKNQILVENRIWLGSNAFFSLYIYVVNFLQYFMSKILYEEIILEKRLGAIDLQTTQPPITANICHQTLLFYRNYTLLKGPCTRFEVEHMSYNSPYFIHKS